MYGFMRYLVTLYFDMICILIIKKTYPTKMFYFKILFFSLFQSSIKNYYHTEYLIIYLISQN